MASVRRRGENEVGIPVVAFDDPERSGADPERVRLIEDLDARRVECGVGRRKSVFFDVFDDGLKEIDRGSDARGERIGAEWDILLARGLLHSFPRNGIVVVVDERLQEKFVAEYTAGNDFLRLLRRNDVRVTPAARACLDLILLDYIFAGPDRQLL